jgi:hypothetical protein
MHALAIFAFVVQHPSMHARYRVILIQTLTELQQLVDATVADAALQRAQELRLLPITDVIQQLFAMVSYLDVVAA